MSRAAPYAGRRQHLVQSVRHNDRAGGNGSPRARKQGRGVLDGQRRHDLVRTVRSAQLRGSKLIGAFGLSLVRFSVCWLLAVHVHESEPINDQTDARKLEAGLARCAPMTK